MTQASGPTNGGVAIVLSGAGARGAYEAGALSVLLPFLRGDDRPRIVLGTSVGALNAAMLAAHLDQGVGAAADALLRGWRSITPAQVFATPRLSLLRYAERRLRRPAGVSPGLLDTDPLRATLRNLLHHDHFASAVTHGSLDAVAVAASSCAEGGAVVFLETTTRPIPPPGSGLTYAPTRLGYEHLMASSAFPLAFPAQWIEGAAEGWYIDGGIHLNTPLKPAIDLGADRILVIGGTPFDIAEAPERSKPPNVMDGSGEILHALLVDSLRADLAALVRTNLQIGSGGGASPAAAAAAAATPTANSAWRVVRFCALNPSDDGLRDAAAQSWPSGPLPLVRSLGGYGALGPVTAQRQRPGQFLSYLCFTPEFISAAISMGIADAQQLVAGSGGIPWATS
jgi:NTE family protein